MSEIEKMGHNRWRVVLESDEATGDLMMPFSPDMLAQAGWDFGDTLEWNINPLTHEVTLKKKQ